MIKIICWILVVNLFQKGFCIEFGQDSILTVENQLIKSLSDLGTMILSEYFQNMRCLCFVSEGDIGQQIFNQIQINLSRYYYHFDNTSNDNLEQLIQFSQQAMEEACFGLIMIVQDPDLYFHAFFEAAKLAMVRGDIIMLHLVTPDEGGSLISDWSANVWASLPGSVFPRSLFTRMNGENEILLVSQKFVGRENYSQEYQVARWLDGSRLVPEQVNLYPDKTRNLRGKQLKVLTFDYRPNTVVFNEPPEWRDKVPNLIDILFTSEEIGLDGIEFHIINAYADHHNATLRYSFEAEYWGDVFPNRSGIGALGHIAEYKAEFAIGAMYNWYPQWIAVEYSVPFTLAGMACLAPKPQTISTWLLIIIPFTWDMWVAVGISILFGTLGLYLASSRIIFKIPGLYSTWSRSLLAVWGILVSQSPPQARGALGDKEDTLTAHMINLLLLAGLLISSGYSGGLSSILTLIRYQPPIETPSDLVEKKVPWVSDDEAWDLGVRFSENEMYTKLQRLFKVYEPSEIQRRARLGQICVAYEAITGDHYALMDYVTEDIIPYLRIMKEYLFWEYEVIMLRKHSPYLFYLNQVMSRLWEGGITLYLTEVSVLHSMDTRLQIAIRNSRYVDQPKETPLRIEHIQAALSLLLIGLIGSTLMFIYELIIAKIKKIRCCK